jgi:hypothetical protein
MKTSLQVLSAIVALLCIGVSISNAQVAGDYRSAVNNGNWGTAATWETYNGASWVTASSQPGSTNDVTIRNGFNVVLDASAKNCKNLIIETGATFIANLTLPTSSIRYVRINGAAATINGVFGNATAPGDAIAFETANNGGTVTITGAGTFAPSRVRVNSSVSGTTTVFDIDTKFMYTGSSGTGGVALYPQTDNNTFTVNPGKTLTFVDNANIAVGSSVSSASGQSVTFAVNGTINLSQLNSSFTLKTLGSGKTATLTVGATGVINIGENLLTTLASDTGSTVITNNGVITVGGTAEFSNPNSVMTGTGSFALNDGATINIGSPAGLDAASGPIRTTTRTFPVIARYVFNNQSANQATGSDFPAHVRHLVISTKNDTTALSKTLQIDTLQVDSSTVLATLTTDTLTVSNEGFIFGTLMNRKAIITNDTLTFNTGSKYVHAVNGASIPLGFWNQGSTCDITGVAGNAPSNGNQNFYHVVWNNSGQSGNLNMGWNGNTIGGNITVVNTGSSRWQMCAPTAGNSATVTINGDVNVSGGQLTTNGTSNAGTTITINHLGNVNVTGGNLSISRGSQGATGTSAWNLLQGNFSMSNATTQNSTTTPGGAKFVFTKDGGTQTLTLGTGNTLTALPIEVDSGTTLSMGTNVLLGSGTFTVEATAGLECANAGGLDSTLKNTGTKSLSKAANYIFDGTSAQTVGSLMPDSANGFTISNASGVTLNDTVHCNMLTVSSGSLLRLDTTGVLSADTGSVNGVVRNADSLVSSKGLVFGNGAVYEHARNGGVIPMGIWEQGSLCKITGFTTATSIAGGGDQDFYNVEWNCPKQTANASLGLYTKAIHGNLTLVSTNTARFYFMGGSSGTITLYGNFIQQAGNFGINGTGSQTFDTVNCLGNVTVTGGNWSVTRGSQSSGTGTSIWNMYGDNFSLSNATTQNSNPPGAKVVFAKQGDQALKLSNITFGGGGMPVEVKGGTKLDLDTSAIGGNGAFTAQSGATLISKLAGGLNGNIATTGTVSLSSGANYIFGASTAQVTGSLLPATVNSLAVQNAAGVTLSSAVSVADSVTLGSGKLILNGKALSAPGVRNAGVSSYIVTDAAGAFGINNVGNTNVVFPVGTSNAYAPLWITNAGTADGFAVKVQSDTALPPSGARVKVKWDIAENTAGGSNLTLQFGWMSSLESAPLAADRPANAKIFTFADTTEAGTGDYTAHFSDEPYAIARGGITSAGSFAVGKFGITTSVDAKEMVPIEFKLAQNYPNPFNPSTVIYYQLPKESRVSLKVYSMLGQELATLVDEVKQAGSYTATFSAQSGFASGVYIYRIHAGDFVSVKKMMLLK